MKKTLIALSLAALSTAAMADVTLYGTIKAGVETAQIKHKERNGNVTTTTKNHTETAIADFGSRIGFKGHENLGNGLNAIWKVEQNTSVAGTDAGWGNRQAYIGLETTAGTFRAGKIGTQLDDMDKVDQWEYSNNALGLDMFTRTGQKVVSVRYDSPVFAGFSANVQFTPRDNGVNTIRGVNKGIPGTSNTTENSGRYNNAKDNAGYYAGLNYENAGFFAQYGFGYKKAAYVTSNGRSKSGQAHRVEAGYDANNLFVSGGYQYTNGWDSLKSYDAALKDNDAYNASTDHSAGLKTHELAVSGAYKLGNVTPKVTYAHGFKAKGKGLSNDQKKQAQYDQVIVGADYDFSKRTTAFAQAGWLRAGDKNTVRVETTAGLVGLRHKF
ncbi:trimeric porin PorB [Neisseria sp. P0008.S010]|uniref:trimeric porin PorB n=1 Tax=Neisseria sp. P0008.S010 TaxID=3436707 RepID=UPI003F803D1A